MVGVVSADRSCEVAAANDDVQRLTQLFVCARRACHQRLSSVEKRQNVIRSIVQPPDNTTDSYLAGAFIEVLSSQLTER